jgi:hypothetical protein
MEDIFKNHNKVFVETLETFLQNIATMFPECAETREKLSHVQSLHDNVEEQDRFINVWYDLLNHKLGRKVKYAKAIERITGENPILLHAANFQDLDAFEDILSLEDVKNIVDLTSLFQKIKSDTMDADNQKIVWKYIQHLNELCYKYMEKPLPYTPSREQIQKNIQEKMSKKTQENSSMSHAFQTTLAELCQTCAFPDISIGNSDHVKELMKKWTNFANDTIQDTKITILCNNKDESALTHLKTHIPELDFENFVISDPNIWSLVTKLNGYASVDDSIPTNMMGKIENFATKLADDIVNGKADLNNMDLSSIGQEVLAQCDEADMNQFANNIDKLLPALKTFQSGPGTKS